MQKNLEKFKGLIFSQNVLLKLTQKGMTRELAYKVVQKNAMKTWTANESFFDNLNNDKQIKSKLSTDDLKKLFNMNSHLLTTFSWHFSALLHMLFLLSFLFELILKEHFEKK